MTDRHKPDSARAHADALFDKRPATDGPAAPSAEVEKIERLRALRLAKERSDKIAADVRKARRQR